MVRGVQHHNVEEALVAHRTARLNVFGDSSGDRVRGRGLVASRRRPKPRASAGTTATSGSGDTGPRAWPGSRIAAPTPSLAPGHAAPRWTRRSSAPGSSGAGDRIASGRSRPSPLDRVRRPRTGRATPRLRDADRPRASRPLRPVTTRARSSTRTTRSSAGSPTAAATGSSGGQTAPVAAPRARLRPLRGRRRRPHPLAYVAHVPDESAAQRSRRPARSPRSGSPAAGSGSSAS